MTLWFEQRLCAVDTETTGVDYETARIVTACVALVGGGAEPHRMQWLADPGVDIPAEASSVHGISTERARAEGRPAAEVVEEIVAALADAAGEGMPIVAMNARFDLTILDREARRHGIKPLGDRVGGVTELRVLDPMVLDKQLSHRRGPRKLTDLCAFYDVQHDGAHDATADAIAAARVLWRIGQRNPRLHNLDLKGLHILQIRWAEEQAVSYERYLAGRGTYRRIEPAWPVVPVTEGGEQA